MILIDSNVIIDSAKCFDLAVDIAAHPYSYASITRVETLGFHEIKAAEERGIETILSLGTQVELTASVIDTAISLRQTKKLSLGDAIVAASALVTGAELWTANAEDFQNIDGLRVYYSPAQQEYNRQRI